MGLPSLRYGFPLDFPDEARKLLQSSENNHTSALQCPDDIEKYINTEREFSAIFGNQTQVSPFMKRPKPDSDNRRIIVDLS